jgi:TRAP transporter 4TM/12TM fusion protein
MMKRAGYSARDAGAIEAVGSTGGQMMPPVMGAAAFLMAEFLEMPYAQVAIAAAVPAALYYFALYIQVDLIAGKERLVGHPTDGPKASQIIKRGWHIGLPFAVLFVTLFHMGMEPEIGGIATAVTILMIGMVRGYGGHRIRPIDVVRTLAVTGRGSAELFITLAAAGLVIGVLNVTGLGFALTLWLVELARQNLVLLLLMAAVVGLVLGMGMPTTAVYVLLAALVAPSIVEAGVPKLAAHMFVLYFGMLSMITPPVALAAFAAASISGAGPMETAAAACRIGWAKFILPFMFVASPTLLLVGSGMRVTYDSVSAGIGIYYVTAAMVGYFRRDLGPAARLLLTISGAAAMVPDAHLLTLLPGTLSLAGIALGAAVLLFEYRHSR